MFGVELAVTWTLGLEGDDALQVLLSWAHITPMMHSTMSNTRSTLWGTSMYDDGRVSRYVCPSRHARGNQILSSEDQTDQARWFRIRVRDQSEAM